MNINLHTALITFIAATAIYMAQTSHPLYDLLKPATTILIIIIPIVFGRSLRSSYMKLTMTAFVFCLLGDILLLRDTMFIAGLIAFLVGHILLILSFRKLNKTPLNTIACLCIIGIASGYFLFIKQHLGALQIPVLAYVIVISLMSIVGLSLYLSSRQRKDMWLVVGVLLFMLSDMILAYNKFIQPFTWSSAAILSTYWAAIYCLARRTLHQP